MKDEVFSMSKFRPKVKIAKQSEKAIGGRKNKSSSPFPGPATISEAPKLTL